MTSRRHCVSCLLLLYKSLHARNTMNDLVAGPRNWLRAVTTTYRATTIYTDQLGITRTVTYVTSATESCATTTNLQPLTTIFTPPLGCSGILYSSIPYANTLSYWRGTSDPLDPLDLLGTVALCYPSSSGCGSERAIQPRIFSPGVCPSGYVVVYSTTSGAEQNSLCCPRYIGVTFVQVSSMTNIFIAA